MTRRPSNSRRWTAGSRAACSARNKQSSRRSPTTASTSPRARSTMGLAPGAKVPMYIADYAPQVKANALSLAAITRLSDIHFVSELPREDAAVAITASGKLMLHVEIDRDAERARLSKEIERVE